MTTKYTTTSKLKDEEIYDSNNYIKVIWEDTLDNHSTIKEKQVEKYFQNKYKTSKVKVIFKPITSKNSDVVVEGTADASELVLDENYQKALIERYIKDNYTIIIQENKPTNGNVLKISIKPRKYKRISDGKIFNRVYSSEANLWYPDGDNYVMDILGVKNDNNTNIPVNIKRLKLRKTRAKEARRQRTRKN